MSCADLFSEVIGGRSYARWSRLFEDVVGGKLHWVWRDDFALSPVFPPGLTDERLRAGNNPVYGMTDAGLCWLAIPFIHQNALLGTFLAQWEGDYKRQVAENAGVLFLGYLEGLAAALARYDELEIAHTAWQRMLTVRSVEDLSVSILADVLERVRSACGVILVADDDGNLSRTCVRTSDMDQVANFDGDHLPASRYVEVFGKAMVILLPDDDPIACWMSRCRPAGERRRCVALQLTTRLGFVGMIALDAEVSEDLELWLDRCDLDLLLESGAATIVNALNNERIQARQRALSTIHTVHRLMGACEGVEELLPRIAEQATRLLGAGKCSIMRLDADGAMLMPAGQVGLDNGEIGTEPVAVGDTIPGYVAETYNPIIVKEPAHDARFAAADGNLYRDDSYVSVPMIQQELVVGVITVSGRPKPFTALDRDILYALGEQSVIAIANVELYEHQRAMTLDAIRFIANLMESGDPQIPGSTEKVARVAERIGERLGISRHDLISLRFASLLHDAGVMAARFGQETENHVDVGVRIAESIDAPEGVISMVEHHHDPYRSVSGGEAACEDEVPLGARIIAVADAYVTLRRDCDPARALAVIRRLSSRRFDPRVVAVLEDVIAENPDL